MTLIPLYESIVRVPSLVSEGGEYLTVISGENAFVYMLQLPDEKSVFDGLRDDDSVPVPGSVTATDADSVTVSGGAAEKGMKIVSQLLFKEKVEDYWQVSGYLTKKQEQLDATVAGIASVESVGRRATALCNLDPHHVIKIFVNLFVNIFCFVYFCIYFCCFW